MKRSSVALVLLVLPAACTAAGPVTPVAEPTSTASVRPTPQPSPEPRAITLPEELTVDNAAFGRSRAKVRQAVADLKRAGLWNDLTDHLYIVKFGSRLGADNVPTDGHLADAYLTAQIDGDVGGGRCDVMFFTTAIRDDLQRWTTYREQGLLTSEPPSLRQFWASIMAHELAHCLDGPNGEREAQRWEERALEAVRRAGIP